MSEHLDPTQLSAPSVDANRSSPEPRAPNVLPPQPELPPEPPAQPQSYAQPQTHYPQPQQHTEPQAQPPQVQPQQPTEYAQSQGQAQQYQPQPQPQAAASGSATSGPPMITEAPPTYSDVIQQPKYGTYPVQQGAVPVQQGAVPVQQGAYTVQRGAYPVQQGAVPVQQGAVSVQQGAVQGAYTVQRGAYPVQQGAVPVQQGAVPVQYLQQPGQPQIVYLQQPGGRPGVQTMPYVVQAPFQPVAALPRPNYPGPHDFLAIALLTTILFAFMNVTSLMFGIPAIVFAIQSKSYKEMANYPAAQKSGKAALGFIITNIVYVLGLAAFIIGMSGGLIVRASCSSVRFSSSRGYYC